MLTKDQKTRIINKHRTHENDTGSPQVQIAILSAEIKDLTDHLKNHKLDHSSRRGLLKKVSERRKLLKYLQKEDPKAFKELAQSLNLKIAQKLQAEEEEKINKEKKLEEIANPLVEEKGDLEEEK
ncbi:30S ribosomal protein S15 [Patescibacteria group bacterium]|nr:30S ribosomal protein S15 [Patescibacteria group bacterium]